MLPLHRTTEVIKYGELDSLNPREVRRQAPISSLLSDRKENIRAQSSGGKEGSAARSSAGAESILRLSSALSLSNIAILSAKSRCLPLDLAYQMDGE